MATEVTSYERDIQPYSNIGMIWVTFPDGYRISGSCSLVGRNDILTATHVVYAPDHGGWAESFDFFFGADFNNITNRFEDYGYQYSPDEWEGYAWSSQVFSDASNTTMLPSESRYDIALIGVSDPIGDWLGWLGLDPNYNNGALATAVGYPDGNPGMMKELVYVDQDSYYQLYESAFDVLGPGSSGGPLLVEDYVIGVKSTGSWWADIGFLYDYILDNRNQNDSLLSAYSNDITAPSISFFNPLDGATGVPTTADIQIAFNEEIERGTGSIVIQSADGIIVEEFDAVSSSRLTISGSTLIIDPVTILDYNTNYYVILMGGAVTDLAGNASSETRTYDFTTADEPSIIDEWILPGFDKAYYLTAKLTALQIDPSTSADWIGKDSQFLETTLANFGFTAESHYRTYGYQEGLSPNAYFDASEYKLAKAVELSLIGTYNNISSALADFEAKWPYDPYLHYLQYGSKEGLNPSNSFDESSYYDAKLLSLQENPATTSDWVGKSSDDLKALFDSLGLSALQHYFMYGANEGIAVTAVPYEEQVSTDMLTDTMVLNEATINLVGVQSTFDAHSAVF